MGHVRNSGVMYDEKWIRQMDNMAANLVRGILRIKTGTDNAALYSPKIQGGLGLRSIKSLLEAKHLALTTMQLNKKTLASLSILASLENPTTNNRISKWQEKIKSLHYSFKSHDIKSGSLKEHIQPQEWKALKSIGIRYLRTITSNNQLIKRNLLAVLTLKPLPEELWDSLQKSLCIEDSLHLKENIASKLKKTKPVKQNIPYKSWLFNYNTRKQNLIWTDGSVREIEGTQIITSAVFCKQGSPLNTVFTVVGRRKCSYIGELAAIEKALEIAPKNRSTVIVTDCLSGIEAIQAYEHRSWSKRKITEAKDYIKRIRKKMREIRSTGGEITYHHIFSHIKEKKRNARKKGPEELHKFKSKLQAMKEKYGPDWKTYKEGNEQADELTGSDKALSNIEGEVQYLGPKRGAYTIRDNNFYIISTNPYKLGREEEESKNYNKWAGYEKRGEILRNEKTDLKASCAMMRQTRGKKSKVQAFVFNARTRNLKTRDQMCHISHARNGNRWEKRPLPDWTRGTKLVTTAITNRKVYNSQECVVCGKGLTENIEHRRMRQTTERPS